MHRLIDLRLLVLVVLAAFSLLPLDARADGDANARALAVQLFDEAEAMVARGEIAKACPKYAESYRLDPQLGALVYLAECYEKNGQRASAWGSYREAEELARKRGDARAEYAAQRAAALEPQLSYLVIEVPASARVVGLKVFRDDAPVAEVVWGARAAIDPGPHRVEARAEGRLPWRQSVVVAAGPGSIRIEVPLLKDDLSTVAAKTETAGSSRRIAALAVGGLGVVGLGIGGFFGLSAESTLSDSEAECSARDICTARGVRLRNSASDKAVVATVATAVGAGALVTAAVLWFTAPKPERDLARDRPRPHHSAWAVAPARDGWGLEVNHAF